MKPMRLVLVPLLLALLDVSVAAASTTSEEAALKYLRDVSESWATSEEKELLGFSATDDVTRATIEATYPVHMLDTAFSDSDRPIEEFLRQTDLEWLLVTIDGVPKTVITVQASDTVEVVGLGWIAAEWMAAATESRAAELRFVWVPDHASIVVEGGGGTETRVRALAAPDSAGVLELPRSGLLSVEQYRHALEAYRKKSAVEDLAPGGSGSAGDRPTHSNSLPVLLLLVLTIAAVPACRSLRARG
jgi:hypothetical protein